MIIYPCPDLSWSVLSKRILCCVAAILGFHGMLNQVQYHKAFIDNDANEDDDDDDDEEGGGKKKTSGFAGTWRWITTGLYH